MNKRASEHMGVLAYYLGSKQRMAQELTSCVSEVCDGSNVLDLFSGMGSASIALSRHFDVVAVDVQEYSRAMCSALLVEACEADVPAWKDVSRYSSAFDQLMLVYEPMVEYESMARQVYRSGSAGVFADVIEHGCMLPEYRSLVPAEFKRVMETADRRRSERCPYDVPVRHFGGTYFSYEQAIEIAAIRSTIFSAPSGVRDILLAGLLCAASHCASTVGGQFAQPLKTIDGAGAIKRSALEKADHQREKSVFDAFGQSVEDIMAARMPRRNNSAIRSECCAFVEGLGKPVDAIYADPPYSRYHYSRYYHVLETIALGDDPSVTRNPATHAPSRGVYRSGRYQSPFSTRMGARGGFERLIKACAAASPSLVLSYSPYPSTVASTPRMMTIDQLVAIARASFGKVEVRKVPGVVHSKLASSKDLLDASSNAEVLIVCKK